MTQVDKPIPRFLDLHLAGQLRVDALVSQDVELSGINAAFDALREGSVVRQVLRF